MDLTRRNALRLSSVALAPLVAGCAPGALRANTPAPPLGIRVVNIGPDRTVDITLEHESTVDWRGEIDIHSASEIMRNLALEYTSYTVSTIVEPDGITDTSSWQWDGCDPEYILIRLEESRVRVDGCHSD